MRTGRITSEAELHRENVQLAWSFADRMTAVQFNRLIEETVALTRMAGLIRHDKPASLEAR